MTRPHGEGVSDDRTVGREQLAVIDAGDELSAATAATLRTTVAESLAGRPHLEVAVAENPNLEDQPAATADLRLLLRDVSTFDQNGLGLLVGLHREARSVGVQLVCVNPPPALFAALHERGLDRVLTVELDVRQ
jgi:anti-anti-sigma regulatory factor